MSEVQEPQIRRTDIRKVALASFIGTAIEWYDYFLYGTAAALVFGVLFFPDFSPLAGTLAAFTTFAVGFFARPVGGIIFGHFGDKIGRKAMLVTTLLIMGIATFLIGLLPTFETIGVWAPILLVTLRVLQGFGVGGEWGGAILMAVEHSPRGRRGFYGSWPQMGVPAGLLLGTGAMYLFATLPEEAFLSWGWRVPFLFSIVLVGVGLYIRLAIEESPAFQRVRNTNTTARMPIVDVLRTYPRSVLIAMGLRVAENGAFYVFTVFVLTYVTTQLGLPNSLALLGVMIAAAVELFTIPFFGSLSDRLGRRPVYMMGAVATLLFAFPFFWFINTQVGVFIWLAIVLALVGHAAMYGTQGAFFSELFGTRVRYSGASLGYQLASVFAGGLSPIIAVALLAWAGSYWPVALYLCFMALITIASVYLASETFRDEISDDDPEEEQLIAESSASRVR
ncbi:MFS transporter, metabolite:H+ symporter (MHS) family protein [Rubrobacter radiotolerans]|uniref:Putative proline/betaine transporter n=1 Tax=Rubrobacter radiotolerans TaxID=42256 RepID=A0A023X1F7_RUBRA|nr:MFS transporter [Rubrobacter radiotolerans]AHY45899.1 MFS transporter, metabolite:H+ symporter (MHS) family protein [Rubrobacter radiotolerans]MDX5893313.1 MFS transporter [Rubrobacter radiotolerans]SMC03484.1 metabolite-proton symporter [Rubrobacter radiotolerans DSM 5868]